MAGFVGRGHSHAGWETAWIGRLLPTAFLRQGPISGLVALAKRTCVNLCPDAQNGLL